MRPQDLTITVLGSNLDWVGERVRSGGLVEVIGEFGFSADAVRAALARLTNHGMLERHRSGRTTEYAITPRARERLAEGGRRVFAFGRTPATSAWTLVRTSIPDDCRVERLMLASRLRFLGFGPLRDAIWIAAGDREDQARELIEHLDVMPYASLFVARMGRRYECAVLSSGAWDLDRLAPRYDEFLSEFSALAVTTARRALSDREAFVTRTRLVYGFRRFSLCDPELPDRMAPLLDRRSRAVSVFDAVYEGLAPAADRYFEEVALRRTAELPAHALG